MGNKKIFLSSPHMGGNELINVQDAFAKNYIAPLGEYVNKLEEEMCKYNDVKGALALSAGTAGLHLALKLCDVKKDDIVFCSSLTFSASANPIMYEKCIPVFIDSEPESFNMSPVALAKAFEKYIPKAVIVVNLYGQSADMDKIKELCDKHNVPIIEDAAESLGATYKGKMSGTIGKYGVYSFNGNKIITTSGGGMLVSNDLESIEKAKFWSTQAKEPARHYEHKDVGYNYRMSNISAAIGVGQMEVLNERIAKKEYIYNKYKEGFKDIEAIEMMPVCEFGKPNYWLSVMTIKTESSIKPLDIILALEKENIESRPVWKPMHIQPVFEKYEYFNHNDSGITVAEDLFDRGICMPSDTKMTDEDIELTIKTVRKLFNKN